MPQHASDYAWLPDQETAAEEDRGILLAIDWIQSVGNGYPVVVSNTKRQRLPQVLERFESRRISPLGRDSLSGPVIAYMPHEAALSLAQASSRGNALVVIESFGYPVREWAAGVGAVDVMSGHVPDGSLGREVREALESALLFGGNNAWSGSHEREDARRALTRFVKEGALTTDAAASYVLSMGRSARAAKGIRQVIDSIR